MKWFKHYSDAEGSESLAELEEKFGFEGLGRYWRLLEFLCSKFDGEDCLFRIHRRNIRQLLRFRSWNSQRLFVDYLATIRGIEVVYSENIIEIHAPILLELQGRDFKKARNERADTAPKIKNKIKNKNKNKNKSHEKEKSAEKLELISNESDQPTASAAGKKTNALITFYCDLFKERYGTNPPITGKDAGILSRLNKNLSGANLMRLMTAYFSMPDSWIVKRKHPLELFESKIKEIKVYAETGNFMTQGDVRSLDQTATVSSQLSRIDRGEL